MNTMWIIWIAAILISFAVLERYAFDHPNRANTLSRFIWEIGQRWPLSLVIYGMVFGGLAVHFYWNWCPAILPAGQSG